MGNGTTTGTIQLSGQYVDDSSIGVGNGASTGTYFVYAVQSSGNVDGLWSANGGFGTASVIKAAVTGTNSVIGFLPTYQMAAPANGTVIFGSGDNGSSNFGALDSGVQLWATAGTAAGTVKINVFGDLAFGTVNNTAGLSGFVSIGSRVLFAYNPGVGGTLQLWSTDGTSAGLQNTGVTVDANSLGAGEAVSTGSKLIFATSAGVYASDGTSTGTILLKAAVAGTLVTLGFVPGTKMAALPDGRVVFGATSYPTITQYTTSIQLWVTDGTVGGTQKIFSAIDYGAGGTGDTSAFTNFVSVGNGVQFEYNLNWPNNNQLYLTDGTTAGTYQISANILDNNSAGAGSGASPLCFLAGTLIATPAGDVAIQTLSPGDLVLTASGAVRPIRWVGHGKVLATTARRNEGAVAIVRAGALADNVPNRDLYLTRSHSLAIDGVLTPVEFLINHRSIVWDTRAGEISVWHVELDSHDVLIANGAPAETFRDDGNGWLFQNAREANAEPPQAPCAEILTGGATVNAIWRRLLYRTPWQSFPATTDDADLHLLVDNRRIEPISAKDGVYQFQLPVDPGSVVLASRADEPAALGFARDFRTLGVAVASIAVVRGTKSRQVEARDERLDMGFHDFEAGENIRWTTGHAILPPGLFHGLRYRPTVIVRLGGSTYYALAANDVACLPTDPGRAPASRSNRLSGQVRTKA